MAELEQFRGVPLPIALRNPDDSEYERHWFKAGVVATLEALPPMHWTTEDRMRALAFVTAKLLTNPVDTDSELGPQMAALTAEEIVKELMP